MSNYPDEAHLDMQFKKLEDALLYLPFDTDAEDDAQGLSPSTESGAIIYPAHITPRVGSGAVQLAEATTNVEPNPSFETNTTGYTPGGSNTIVQSTDQAKVGDYSAKCTYQDHITFWTEWITLTAAIYTGAVWVYIPSDYDGGGIQFTFLHSGATIVAGDANMALTDQWQMIKANVTPVGGSEAGNMLLKSTGATPTAGKFIYCDAVQVEQKAYPTPYCDGSLGAGHSWSGTAHASTSLRTKTELAYTVNLPAQWTIEFWHIPLMLQPETPNNNVLFQWYGDSNDYLKFYMTPSGDFTRLLWYAQGTANYLDYTGDQWVRFVPIHYAVTYDGTDLKIYQNGSILSGETESPTQPAFGTTPSILYIGSDNSLANQPNGWMDELITLDYALTGNEVRNLYYEGLDGRAFDGIWTSVIDDVLAAGSVGWNSGFFGMKPIDRTAGAGTMPFFLDNSENNSAGLLGYYSVGHANAREGFEIGIKTRLWFIESSVRYYKFIGKLTKATPLPGKKRARKVDCSAVDWLGAATLHKVNLIDVEEGIRSDVAFQTIVENLVTQPEAASYGVGQETFAYWGDDLKDERTTGRAALDRVDMSEFGYSFIRGGSTPGELVFQNRHARVKDTTVQKTFIEDDLSDMKVRREQRDIKNRVEATVYPREVSLSDESLYSLQTPLLINAGQKKTISARYTDPDNRDVRLAGLELNDPEGLNAYVDQGSIDDRGFEGGVGNWVPLGDDADAVAQSPDQAKIGTYSLKLTSGTGAAHTQWAGWTTALSGFVQNDVVYYQTYIYLGAAWPHGVEVIIQERTSGGAWLKDHAIETIVATGAWVRVSGSITVAEATAAKLRFLIGSSIDDFSGGAVSVYIDEVYLIHDTLINFGFSESDAGGGDKNNDLVLIESLLGGNMSEFVLENISDVDGYVMPLKVRGRTVRRYDPVMQYAENGVSIDDHYKRIQTLQLKYQDDPLVGQDWANKVLSDRELPETILESCLVHATKSAGNLAAILDLEPGERIEISESVAAIDDEYFINGIGYKMQATDQGVALMATFFVVLAGIEAYWLLGIVGASELGQTTWFGF